MNSVWIFFRCINDNIFMVGKVFKNDMVIQEFDYFCSMIENLFDTVAEISGGEVSNTGQLYSVEASLCSQSYVRKVDEKHYVTSSIFGLSQAW